MAEGASTNGEGKTCRVYSATISNDILEIAWRSTRFWLQRTTVAGKGESGESTSIRIVETFQRSFCTKWNMLLSDWGTVKNGGTREAINRAWGAPARRATEVFSRKWNR